MSALERALEQKGTVIIVTPTDALADLICADLMAFAGGQLVTILPIRVVDDLQEQRNAFSGNVDIVVGSMTRISSVFADLPEDSVSPLFLGFCDLSSTLKEPEFTAFLSVLKSTEQLFAFYSEPIKQVHYSAMKDFHSDLQLIDFRVAPQNHKRQFVRTKDKISVSLSLALSTERSIAFVCKNDEESQALSAELAMAGITNQLLWSKTNRRNKDKILRQMRSNRVQCLITTQPNVDRNVASEIVLFGIPENLSSISGFPGSVTWLLEEAEDATAIDSLNPVAIEPPLRTQAQLDREKRILSALVQAASTPSVTVWESLIKQILKHPQKESLLCAALSQFAANARSEGHERLEDVSRLESKEERSKSPQKRHRRKGRHRRRR